MQAHISRSVVAVTIGFLLLVAVPQTSEARVVRFAVEQQLPFVGGVSWGKAGPYDKLLGTADLEVDPRDPLNALIVDLENAPKNERGMVVLSTPFFILKPVDMSLGNHKIYYTVNNRGNDSLIPAETIGQVGSNDIYLRMGYTIVDAGWEGDAVPTAINLVANLPIATQPDGSPIIGRMRVEYSDRTIPLDGTFTMNLEGSPAFRSYETADTDTIHSTFTVRDDVNAPRIPISSDRWGFGRCETGKESFVPSPFDICYFDGFSNDKLYELIYPAKNPIVMGLGYAITRDIGSFLRYESQDDFGNPNPLGKRESDAPMRLAPRKPPPICATSCTWASMRMSRTARYSTGSCLPSPGRSACFSTCVSRTPMSIPSRKTGMTS